MKQQCLIAEQIKRDRFFDSEEFGNAHLNTTSGSLCVQVHRTLNTWISFKANCKKLCGGVFHAFFFFVGGGLFFLFILGLIIFVIEGTKQSLKCLLELRGKSCFKSITKNLILNIFKWHMDANKCLLTGTHILSYKM